MELNDDILRKEERKKLNKLHKVKKFNFHGSTSRQYDFLFLIHRNSHRFNRKPILVTYSSFTFEIAILGISVGFTCNYNYKEQDFSGHTGRANV